MISVNGREISITTFPNKERKVDINCSIDSQVFVNWKYENDGDFLLLNMVDDAIDRKRIEESTDTNKVNCIINSMPYERMDRSQNGSVFSLEVACNLLPKGWNYTIIAPHSDVCVNLLKATVKGTVEKVHVHNYLFNEVKENDVLSHLFEEKNVLVFPDEGAKNRYSKIISEQGSIPYLEIVYGKKHRNFETGNIEKLTLVDERGLEVKDLNGINAIVVDDLSSYGGTFIKLKEVLDECCVKEAHLFLEKAEDSILKGRVLDNYDSVHTTNLMMDLQTDDFNNPNFFVKSSNEIVSMEFLSMALK